MKKGLLVCLIAFVCINASAQQIVEDEGVYHAKDLTELSVEQLPSVHKLFETDEVLQVQIATNMEKLILFKEDPDYQKAMFTITVADSLLVVKKIRIKVRGKTRVTICEDPPLKIDFKKSDFQWDWFDKLKSLKVVTPCDDQKVYTKYLMKEYFAYIGYQALTDVSYRVRMIELTLVDTQGKVKPEVKYAFLVENDSKLAKRTGLKELESDDISAASLIQQFYLEPTDNTLFNINVLALYQYMIGNTDWTTNRLHNVKVFKKDKTLHPVPYDFDYSGLVNASYAVPSSSMPITHVTERCYLGPCSDKEDFDKAVEFFIKREQVLRKVLREDQYISEKTKAEILEYLEGFFAILHNPSQLEAIRTTNCNSFSAK